MHKYHDSMMHLSGVTSFVSNSQTLVWVMHLLPVFVLRNISLPHFPASQSKQASLGSNRWPGSSLRSAVRPPQLWWWSDVPAASHQTCWYMLHFKILFSQAFPALHWKAGSAFGWPDNRFTVGTSVTFGDFCDFYGLGLVFLLRDLDVLLHLLIQTRYHKAYTPPGPLLRLDNGSGILLGKMCWLQLKTDNLIKYVKMPSMHSDAMLVTVQDASFQTFCR